MKKRILYGSLLLVTMVLGLASRKYGDAIPEFIATYAGDTLWALLVYWLIRFAWPKGSIQRAFAGAIAFAFLIEISQLYQAPWINDIRNSTLGALVLGHGFLWSDFICYTTGIIAGVLMDRSFLQKIR